MFYNTITGTGIALRAEHFEVFLSDTPPTVAWLEILADNYLNAEGIAFDKVVDIAAHYPIVLHCVNAGVGNSDPINWSYCQHLKKLIAILKPAWISDHLCWTALNNHHTHSLLPLPFTEETIQHTAKRIAQLQDYFELPFLIENIAAYLRSPYDTFNEVAFLNAVATEANCQILLDINNLYVNCVNHQESVENFLQQINADRVWQYHLAGHEKQNALLIDTHNQKISDATLNLYQKALTIIGTRPTCLEWDSNIPVWAEIAAELNTINRVIHDTTTGMATSVF